MVINYGLIGFSGTTGWIWRLKMVKFSIPKMANRSGKWWSKHWGHPVFRDIFWGITALILQCKRSLGFNSQGVIYREILELMQDTLSPSKWMAFFLIFSCHDFLNLAGYKNPVWCLWCLQEEQFELLELWNASKKQAKKMKRGTLFPREQLGAGLNNKHRDFARGKQCKCRI